MIVFDIYFKRFKEVSLYEVLSTTGVYVIWDSQAKAKPSYIGEGDIIKRLSKHDDRYAQPLDGYVGIIQKYNEDPKLVAQAVEALLLVVGDETDRSAKHNGNSGKQKCVEDICKRYKKLRVRISGYDPLRSPTDRPKLTSPKLIEATYNNERANIEYYHEWKYRKRKKL